MFSGGHQKPQPLMGAILTDTSVIFDHLNGRYGRSAYLEQLIEQGHVLACCPVNITEVYAGLRSGEATKTAAFLDTLECFARDPGNRQTSRPVAPGLAEEGSNPFLYRRDHRRRRFEQRGSASNR